MCAQGLDVLAEDAKVTAIREPFSAVVRRSCSPSLSLCSTHYARSERGRLEILVSESPVTFRRPPMVRGGRNPPDVKECRNRGSHRSNNTPPPPPRWSLRQSPVGASPGTAYARTFTPARSAPQPQPCFDLLQTHSYSWIPHLSVADGNGRCHATGMRNSSGHGC